MVVWTVFNRVRFGAASAADRAGVDIEDGAADLALGVLEHVRRVDGLAFSVVSTEHAYLQHGMYINVNVWPYTLNTSMFETGVWLYLMGSLCT